MEMLRRRRRVPLRSTSSARGSAGLLTVLGGCLVLLAGLGGIVAVVDLGVAAARARAAADAAALAAAAAMPLAGGDGDDHAAAVRLASANGGRVTACCGRGRVSGRTDGGLPDMQVVRVVEVAVPARLPLLRAAGVAVRARAAAALGPGELPAVLTGPDGAAADTGRLRLPVSGHVTSGYGLRVHPVSGRRRLHTGVDLAAPAGIAVVAADEGVVVSAGWRGGYGLTVVVAHGGGLSTLSAHQSRVVVAAGQRVRRGEVIGAVGCTGTCTGPHLHFEVRVGGRPTNPLPYLRSPIR